jgi:hypothetical protein
MKIPGLEDSVDVERWGPTLWMVGSTLVDMAEVKYGVARAFEIQKFEEYSRKQRELYSDRDSLRAARQRALVDRLPKIRDFDPILTDAQVKLILAYLSAESAFKENQGV